MAIPILVPNIPNFATPVPVPEPDAPFVARFWTAGPGSPQEAIRVGEFQKLRPGRDGAIVVRDPDTAAFVRQALGPRAWEDDIAPDAPSMECTACSWSTRSTRAYQHHVNNLHPGPRTGR